MRRHPQSASATDASKNRSRRTPARTSLGVAIASRAGAWWRKLEFSKETRQLSRTARRFGIEGLERREMMAMDTYHQIGLGTSVTPLDKFYEPSLTPTSTIFTVGPGIYDPNNPLTFDVNLSISGTATRGSDYEIVINPRSYTPTVLTTNHVQFSPYTELGIRALHDDDNKEWDEYVEVAVIGGDGYEVASNTKTLHFNIVSPDLQAPSTIGTDEECGCSMRTTDSLDQYKGAAKVSQNGAMGTELASYSGADLGMAVVSANHTVPKNEAGEKPDRVEVELTIGGVSSGTVKYTTANVGIGDEVVYTLQADMSNVPTGTYAWTMKAKYYWGGNAREFERRGFQNVTNLSNSPIGKGWQLNVDSLSPVGDQVMLTRSDGTITAFPVYHTPPPYIYSGPYAPLDDDPYSQRLDVNTYFAPNQDQSWYYVVDNRAAQGRTFRSTGQITQQVKQDTGVTTNYYYPNSSLIYSESLPSHFITAYTFSGGYLTSIREGATITGTGDTAVATGGIETDFTIQGGLLTKITKPDDDGNSANGTPYVDFEYYSGTGLLKKVTKYANSTTVADWTQYSYSGNQVTRVDHADGTYELLTSSAGSTLVLASQTTTTPHAAYLASGQAATYQDRNATATTSAFDAHGLMTSTSSSTDGTTTYAYDPLGRVTQMVSPDPDRTAPFVPVETNYTYSTSDAWNREPATTTVNGVETVHNTIDSQGRISVSVDELGRETRYTYDGTSTRIATSRQVIGLYDLANGVTELDDLVTRYQYTSGLPDKPVQWVQDPNGIYTYYEYFTTGPKIGLVKQIRYDSNAGGTGQYSHEDFDYDSYGNMTSHKDELGRETTYTYDGWNRKKTESRPDPDGAGGLPAPIYTYEYNTRNQITKLTEPDPDGTGPRTAKVTTYAYTDNGRTLTTTETDGGSGTTPIVTVQKFDALGNVVEETNALGGKTTYVYDSAGRLGHTILPDPDGPTGPLSGSTIYYTYDALGRLKSTTEAAPVTNSAPTAIAETDVSVTLATSKTSINLWDVFADAQDADNALRYSVVSNTNAGLFDSITIEQGSPSKLLLDYRTGVIDSARITIRATDSAGGTKDYSFDVVRTAAPGEARVNATTEGTQTMPRVAVLADGTSIVAWEGQGAGDDQGIYYRRFAADQSPLTGEIAVKSSTAAYAGGIAVTATPDGGFAIAWQESNGSGAGTLMLCRYSATGVAETPVSIASLSGEVEPRVAIAATADNYVTLAWVDNDANDEATLYAQYYGPGDDTAPAIVVNTSDGVSNPTIAATQDSGLTFAWTNGDQRVVLRRFSTSLVPLSAEVRIDTNGGSDEDYVVAADGGLVMAWNRFGASSWDIIARRFGADGTPAGKEILVNPTSSNYRLFPWVSLTANGGFIATWTGLNGTGDFDVYAQRFAADDSKIGSAELINTTVDNTQGISRLAVAPDGRAVVAWLDDNGDGEVYLRTVSAFDLPQTVESSFRVVSVSPGENVLGPVDRVLVTFSKPVDMSTFTSSDVVLKDPDGLDVALQSGQAGIVAISATQAMLVFTTAQSKKGEYRLTLGPSISKVGGGSLDQDRDGTAGETNDDDKLFGTFRIAQAAPTAGAVTQYFYDSQGRMIETIDPAGNSTTTSYSFNATTHQSTETVHDASGDTVSLYDGAGRLIQVTYPDADGTGTAKSAQTVKYTYDKNGNLIDQEDQLHNHTAYKYDNLNRLLFTYQANPATGVAVSGGVAQGPWTGTTYNFAGEVLTTTDPIGRVTSFEYDGLGRLKKRTDNDPDGTGSGYPLEAPVTDYEYDLLGNLTKLTQPDPDGSTGSLARPVADYAIDFMGRVKAIDQPDPDGTSGSQSRPHLTYTYDAMGNVKSSTDALGKTTTYQYDSLGRLTDVSQPAVPFYSIAIHPKMHFDYDSAGRIAKTTDPLGRVTQFGYDARGSLINQINALGGITSFEFNAQGQVTAQIDSLGHAKLHEFDKLGRETKTTLPDPDGFGGAQAAPVITYDYDDANRLLWQTDPRSTASVVIKTEFAYDHLNRLTKVTAPLPTSGSSTHPVTSYTYYADGQVEKETDPLGRVRYYSYDGLGRLKTMNDWSTATLGAITGPLTSYAYDALSRLISVTQPDPDGSGSGNPLVAPVTQYTYDALGRRTSLIEPDPDGNPNSGASSPVTQYFYDAAGNLTKQIDPANVQTQFVYDNLSRRTKSIDASNNETLYSYDLAGNQVSVTDPQGFTSLTVFDALNRVTDQIDQRQGTTHYTYDAAGRRTSLTDAIYNTSRFEFDALNRLTRDTDPLGNARTYGYDIAGNLVRETDRDGQVRTFDFDNLNRKTAEHWLNSSGTSTRDLTWSYTLADEPSTAGDSAATYSYHYDIAGRVDQLTESLTNLGHDVRLDQTYDQLNRRLSVTGVVVNGTAWGARNDYQYDSLSRMTQAKQGVPNVGTYVRTVDFTYTATGDFATITRNSVAGGTATAAGTSTYHYDSLGHLDSLVHKDPSQNVIASYLWTYDTKGQVTTFTSTNTADGTTTYDYDASGQLTSADYTSNIPDESYVYDLNGNRAYGGYKTGPGNQLLEDGTFRYEYDNEGNRRFKTRLDSTYSGGDYKVEYVWDYRQRLTDVIFKNNSGTVTKSVHYDYDLFDRLIAKTLDADGAATGVAVAKTYTVYDGDDVLFDFLDANTSSQNDAVLTKRYLHGPAVDQILSEQDATTWGITYHLADNLGTVRDLTGYNGNLVTHVRYDAFGQIIDETNTGWSNRYKFTGREFDKDSGLQYNRARWYDPVVGRWLNPDPMSFAAGDANLYRYVRNDPTNLTDPSGTHPWTHLPDPTPPPTEQELLDIVWEKVYEWSNKGWDLAAALLDTFLGRKNVGTDEDLIDFSRFSGKVKNDSTFLQTLDKYLSEIAQKYGDPCKVVTLKLKDIIPDFENLSGAFRVGWNNPSKELFWAFRGASFGHTGAELVITPVLSPPVLYTWSFSGNIHLFDDYTFPWKIYRNVFPSYNAAYMLEQMNYNAYGATMAWQMARDGVVISGGGAGRDY